MGEGPPGVFLGVVEEEFGEEGEGEEEEDWGEGFRGLGWHCLGVLRVCCRVLGREVFGGG